MSKKDFWEGYVPEPVKPATTETNGGKTGWPPGLLQDDCKGLSKWLSNKPDAKRRVREALDKMAENARELGLDYEPVCNKDPQGCWNVRCQLGKKCKNASAQQEPVACECHRCIDEKGLNVNGLPLSMTKMILCPECGNKRCPKASDHRLACTNSNEPGQPGSIYTSPPAQQEPVATITITQRGPIRIIDNNFDDCVRGWPDGEYNLYTSPQPAQRTWVGLVWGELPEDGQNHDFLRGAVWAETKLKEKNQ